MLGIHKNNINDFKLEFPEENKNKTNLTNIIKFNMKGSLKISDNIIKNLKIPDECVLINLENNESENKPHPYLIRKRDHEKEYKNKTFEHLFSFGKRISPIHVEILDIRNPCKTIIYTYEHQPRLLVLQKNNNGYFVRMLLVDELKQIQSFPKDYKICGSEKEQIIQIGNEVPQN